jgi:hypothetical protein
MKCNRACPRAHCLGRNGVTERANLIVSQIMAVVTIRIMRDKDPRRTPLKVAYSPFGRDRFVGQGVGQVFQS